MLEIVESDKFQDNFTMALCSFGGVDDQCGATSWAVHETRVILLLSCNNDMTAWLKDKYQSQVRQGREEDLVIPKLQMIQKIR